jgi:hypothetical protein
MKISQIGQFVKTNPKRTQPVVSLSNLFKLADAPVAGQFQRQKMLMSMKINPRPNPLGYYPDWRLFAADHGLNLSCFVGLPFAHSLIFSEKKQQLREIPDKAGAGLCRFIYIRKTLYFWQGLRIISADFRLKIENNRYSMEVQK